MLRGCVVKFYSLESLCYHYIFGLFPSLKLENSSFNDSGDEICR